MKMFSSFRWQIAMSFLILSTLIYCVLSLAGGAYFFNSLTNSMDHEFKVVGSQIGHAIELSGSKPTFRDWLRVVETEPARSVMAIQLYDTNGALLEHYGPTGIPRLELSAKEIGNQNDEYRVFHSKLMHKGRCVGYLQLQLSTTKRGQLTREFLWTMACMAPFVFLGFAICGYVVSGMASKPIEKLVATLQRLVADAGHELNTPASIVQARAQSLQRKLSKEGGHESDLKIIADAAERMGFIVKNLMVLAELDSQNKSTTRSSTSLNDQLNVAVTSFRDRFEEKHISFHTEITEQIFVNVDRESLQCIISNLLENALKYTEASGEVKLKSVIESGEAKISISDTGIGIPPEDLSKIFERFYRVDKSRSRASGGAGLGLAIVKSIAENHKGTVTVSSQPGVGSQFTVNLPLDKATTIAQNLHTTYGQL